MPARETGKQRAVRIPLDYYKHPDRIERWKLGLGGVALAAAVAWPVLGLIPLGGLPDAVEETYSRGPVAAVHATWEADCAACHTPFSPIRDQGVGADLLGAHEGSAKCVTCHAGPPHHRNQEPHEQGCATCHHDHRGRDASLVRVADGDCTSCHAHFTGDKERYVATRFAEGTHPAFKIPQEDPGHLKFNHKLHLTAGLVPDPDGKVPWTFADITEKERERYLEQQQREQGGQKPAVTDPVQLSCASCHVTDASDAGIGRDRLASVPAAAVLPSRRSGAYMLPITYEAHCRACHPLTFERKDPDDPKSGRFTLAHRLDLKEAHTALEGRYTALVLADKAKAFERFVPLRPLPGKLLEEDKKEQLAKLIRERVERAERDLFQSRRGCGECHYTQMDKDGIVPKTIEPTRVQDVWFRHALFDHTAHRAVDCLQCHAGVRTSEDKKNVLLPPMSTCLECHAPRTAAGGTPHGGARFDCVECHRYHNGDVPEDWNVPLPGLGAGARGVPLGERLSVEPFLSGDSRTKTGPP
jgi:hypothetical protein